MNKQEKSYLEKIYQDVLELEKQGNLTMSGAGMGNLCNILLGKQNPPFRWVEERYVKCKHCQDVFFLEFNSSSETHKLRLMGIQDKE